MRRLIILLSAAAIVLIVGMGASSCEDSTSASSPDHQRKVSVKERAKAFARAEAKYPLPRTENFPLRKMLVEMTKREDLDNHPWYIYVLGDPGNVIGYYVAKTVPINACDFLGSTQQLKGGYNDNYTVLKAPSVDGIYYGDSACNVFVFQDYSTGAIVKLGDVKYFVADKPLNVEAEAIGVKR